MAYILTATTRGDDLIPARTIIVAESHIRKDLERLTESRARERKSWLSGHQLPWWALECVIASEEIVAVESI